MLISRWLYYLSSIPTLLFGVVNLPRMLMQFAGLQHNSFTLILRNGYRFRVRSVMDVWIIKETCLDRDYERAGTDIVDGWTVIDIGGGLGDFTVHAAKSNPSGLVYAFEPFPESHALLLENLDLNGVSNARVFEEAVAGETGTLRLDTGASAAVRVGTSDEGVVVRSTSLDEVFEREVIARCDLLKIDCEGGEYDILFGVEAETFARIDRICMEYHDDVTDFQHGDLIPLLEAHGFRLRVYPNPAHKEIGLLYAEKERR